MNKIYCDICLKEIVEGAPAGHLVGLKKIHLAMQSIPSQPKIVKEEIDLCETCIGQIFDLLEAIKETNSKMNKDLSAVAK